ncbi:MULTISPECIES: anti-sigma factor family protein [Paraburkholderia]|jgi:anti-sigma factor RsiW|uniref:Uncharacterized protein n=1 Tax=Paraburkholderia strydomiana TaxID=1245417 RepID=A0ABW9C544_9BURK
MYASELLLMSYLDGQLSADASYAFEITLQLRPALQTRAAALRRQYEALQAAFARQHLPPMSANVARRIELLVRGVGKSGQ